MFDIRSCLDDVIPFHRLPLCGKVSDHLDFNGAEFMLIAIYFKRGSLISDYRKSAATHSRRMINNISGLQDYSGLTGFQHDGP